MSSMWKAYGKHAAFGLKRLDVAMRVNLRCFWVESSDELPMPFGVQILLAFHDYGFVSPDCVSEMLDVCIRNIVQIQASDYSTKLANSDQPARFSADKVLLTLCSSLGLFSNFSTVNAGSGNKVAGAIFNSILDP